MMFTTSTRSLLYAVTIFPRELQKLIGAKIDDVDRHFLKNFTIFQACLVEKIYLPRFCYHTSLSIAGNCRMCLVEEKSTIKPVASCAVNIDGNMEIYTCTVMVKKARESVLEYLLINHPLDCPICDQGGECDLQDQTMVFGADRGRFYEDKRTVTNKNFGFLIKTFFNRCIYCARCTRFMQELGGVDSLGLLGRGLHSEIGTYFSEFLTSEVSGNIIDLCPVGALTSKPYAYRTRVWELVPVEGFDIIDSFGATIKMECRGLEVMRILPASNDVLNEEWISDRSRFFYDSLQLQRLTSPLIYKKKIHKEISWTQSFRVLRTFFLKYFKWGRLKRRLTPLTIFQGALNDLETLVSCEDLYGFSGASTFVVSYRQMSRQVRKQRALYTLRSARLLEESTHYLVCGVHLRYESPIMNMKMVQFYGNNDVEIFVLGKGAEINVEFHHLGSMAGDAMISQLICDDYYSRTTKRLVLYGHSFLNAAELFSTLRLFRAQFSFIGLNIVDVGMFELGRVQENIQQNIRIFQQARFTLSLAGDDYSWARFRAKLRQLLVYVGHHGGSSASAANLLLPAPVFIEKSSSFLNNCAFFLSSYTYEYRFNMKVPKQEWQILRAFNDVMRFKRSFTYKTSEQLRRRLNRVTPLQGTHGNYFRQLHFLPVTLALVRASLVKLNIKSALPNFYKINILCVMSQTLELCSRQYIDIAKTNELDNIN